MGIMKLKTAAAPLIFSLLAGTALSAHASWYITDIGTPAIGATNANDINDQGQIVGGAGYGPGAGASGFLYENGSLTLTPSSASFTAINNRGDILGSGGNGATYSAFVFQNGQTTYLPGLGGGNVFAYGINDSGQVVGMANHAGTTWLNAFVYSNGTMHDYGGLPGAVSTYAYAINNSGAFTGISFVNGAHSFIYQNGSMTDLGSLGGSVYAQAINNANQVVGWADIGTTEQAFLYSNGTLTNITAQVGMASGRATDINDRGQIIGTTTSGEVMQSFLYSNGSLTNLSTLPEVVAAGWSNLWAKAINNVGDIVGVGRLNGIDQAFVLSPNRAFAAPISVATFAAPEIDGNGALMGLALLGGLLSLMRRRKTDTV